MSAQPKDWADEVAKRIVATVWGRRADGHDIVREMIREIWKSGRETGFVQGQQSVIDFQQVVRNAATGQWPS